MAHEDPSDVRGEVAEEIAYVRVLGDASAGEPCLEAIDYPATVRVDEAANQRSWMSVRELKLPISQEDRAKVLPSNSVLRKRSDDRRMADAQDVGVAGR